MKISEYISPTGKVISISDQIEAQQIMDELKKDKYKDNIEAAMPHLRRFTELMGLNLIENN